MPQSTGFPCCVTCTNKAKKCLLFILLDLCIIVYLQFLCFKLKRGHLKYSLDVRFKYSYNMSVPLSIHRIQHKSPRVDVCTCLTYEKKNMYSTYSCL